MVMCLQRGAESLHIFQLIPVHPKTPLSLLHHLHPDWFYLSGTELLRLSWKRGRYACSSSRPLVVVELNINENLISD